MSLKGISRKTFRDKNPGFRWETLAREFFLKVHRFVCKKIHQIHMRSAGGNSAEKKRIQYQVPEEVQHSVCGKEKMHGRLEK